MLIFKIRRNSIGITTRPNSSTFLTIPVDFIKSIPFIVNK
ncbi:hypothetical protein BMWSH_3262 [Priestia megaterium WSH-002]|uniref:Uncharacterized protein n=1 Tax=Priestia megaterium (strain WSH-002) TaxID=1006007 RepID=A0A8D4BPZ5_PRIMW|nr:hypothetical protein BMWSH_3262 [Priestia megaterium WSH-002]